MTDELDDIWNKAMDRENSEMKPRVSSFALELENRYWIMDKILDVLELELAKSIVNCNKMQIYLKKSKICLFSDLFLDVADAALFILNWLKFYIDFSKHDVNNPLHNCTCVEEILVKLNLLEDTKSCARAGASDET